MIPESQNSIVPLLNPEEVANCLRISERALADLDRRREIAHVKFCGRRHYEPSAVVDFINRKRRAATARPGPALQAEDWGRIEQLINLAVNKRLAA